MIFVKYKIAANKPSLKGKVANRRFVGRALAFSIQKTLKSTILQPKNTVTLSRYFTKSFD